MFSCLLSERLFSVYIFAKDAKIVKTVLLALFSCLVSVVNFLDLFNAG